MPNKTQLPTNYKVGANKEILLGPRYQNTAKINVLHVGQHNKNKPQTSVRYKVRRELESGCSRKASSPAEA